MTDGAERRTRLVREIRMRDESCGGRESDARRWYRRPARYRSLRVHAYAADAESRSPPRERWAMVASSDDAASLRLEPGREDVSPAFLLLRQPQTWRIQDAMLTSCSMMLTIHGCASMSFGVGRTRGSRVSAFLMKSFISGLQVMSSSSSSSGGSFCVMWNISSIAARSLGNGKRFWTSSSREMPVDQTSDLIVPCTLR